jgi:hypothetical protein
MAGSGGSGGMQVRQSVEQLMVTHAHPDTELRLSDSQGREVQTGVTDKLGSLIFRKVPPGDGYLIATTRQSPEEHTRPLHVMSIANSLPAQSFYSSQKLVAGNGYITTRDGTKLSVFITLPGPIDQGPYPTVIDYSGYDPSRPGAPIQGTQVLCKTLPTLCDAPSAPAALIAALMGYATVGVNMRGTGCSGGAYDFFEELQLLDGYDVVETVAAQDWALGHRVGMVGLSYPGITQLFVGETRPPSLAAITPLSVIGNTASTLEPGGILNDGFAIDWATHVLDKADPYGQGWEQDRVDAGDTICEENQLLHLQKVDIIQKAFDTKYYDPAIVDPLNPTLFVHKIDVPVFLAGAWQDEQTGPFFTTLLDKFKSAPLVRFNVYNGVHPDGFAPHILTEWKTFLDLYVAHRVPSIAPALLDVAPLLFKEIFGVSMKLSQTRFASYADYDKARADYEKELPLRAIFEDGGEKSDLGAPAGTFEHRFSQWPPAETQPQRWYFEPDGSLGQSPPTVSDSASSFNLDPGAGERGILAPGGNIWDALPDYAWPELTDGDAVAFVSAPLQKDLLMLGTGSVDMWIKSTVDDADLEINLTEVRPDGKEMYVQSGWLRASERKLGPSSTDLWPEPTFMKQDVQPLVPGQWVKVRVAIAGFSHVFRKGSRIRVSVDTPGDSRSVWRFRLKTFPNGATHTVAHSSTYPSSVLLPVISGVPVTTPLPPCPSLRGEPCRKYVAYVNTPAQ